MIIIRCNQLMMRPGLKDLERDIRIQAASGLIVLPDYCEVLHVDPVTDPERKEIPVVTAPPDLV